MLTIAVQKSGRLYEGSLKLLGDAGISFPNGKNAKLQSQAENFPLRILFLRDDDIPEYVSSGIVDAGIVGENVCREKNKPVAVLEQLGFARCRMCIAVPRERQYRRPADLAGLKIATTYPGILKGFLQERGISAELHEISGSVEVTPGIGLADAIFDIVSTGNTLTSNGLKVVETVLESQAVLAAHPRLSESKQALLEQLRFRIRAVLRARDYKYILLNSPNSAIAEITRILPGMKSPTVMPLALEGWSSVHTVIREDEFWEIIESLKAVGAQGILVIPIEKMIV